MLPHPVEPALAAALVDLAGATSHGILLHDSDGVIMFANGAAAALLGTTVDELLGNGLRVGERFCYADGSALAATELPATTVVRSSVDRAEAVLGIRDPGDERPPRLWVYMEATAVTIAGRRGAATLMFDISDRYATRNELKGILETLQRTLVPESVSTIEGVDLAVRYRAADGMMIVGGDFYDTVVLDDSALDFFIGDVQGHGVAAAALTAVARHTFRAAALERCDAPTAMHWLHRALKASPSDRSCTAAFGCISRHEEGRLDVSYCLGGHPQPIVLDDNGAATFEGEHGTLLGLVDVGEFPETTVSLTDGMAMVFYTDGLTDAVSPRYDDAELLAAATWQPTAGAIADQLMAFGRDDPTRSGGLSDDTALFVIAPTAAARAGRGAPPR